ncbi:MAG: type VI secretion system tip protein VgrG [Balneolaceae bacterium]|nr:type VI secretion system tip protein VgrG [Balneolaceae bacterium]
MLNGFLNRDKPTDLVTFELLVNGESLPQTVEVFSVDIWKELNRIPRAKIVILDGDPAEEIFKVSEGEWFIPGNEIEILAGYHSDNQSVFSGIVTTHSIKSRQNGGHRLTVECCDKTVKLTTVPKSRYFYDMKESDMFREIIQSYSGLDADIEDTGYTHKELLQFQSTDWDFILNRADVNGLFCTVAGGNISIKKPDFLGRPTHKAVFGRNMYEIDAEIDASSQLAGVKGTSWDYSKTEPSGMDATSQSPVSPGNLSSNDLSEVFQNHEWILRSGGKIPVELIHSWVNTKQMKHELAKVRGRVRIEGSPVLPGNIITLEGLGDRFNGNAFVSGVKHSIGRGEWLTDIQYGLSPEWFSEQFKISIPPSAGLHASISGLHAGLVTQIQDDPEGDERILVRLPMVDTEEQGVWARLATTGAGDERGLVFRPEIGDEVIVGFIDDDPNQPVILGSVHSANNPAPIEADDENHKKGWTSRSGIEWKIDEEKPSMKVKMPSGRMIRLDDDSGEMQFEDGDENKITLNANGITIETSGDLILKAQGDINIDAGVNLNAEANAAFTAKGSSTAELSSSGQTVVKGSLVQIN